MSTPSHVVSLSMQSQLNGNRSPLSQATTVQGMTSSSRANCFVVRLEAFLAVFIMSPRLTSDPSLWRTLIQAVANSHPDPRELSDSRSGVLKAFSAH